MKTSRIGQAVYPAAGAQDIGKTAFRTYIEVIQQRPERNQFAAAFSSFIALFASAAFDQFVVGRRMLKVAVPITHFRQARIIDNLDVRRRFSKGFLDGGFDISFYIVKFSTSL